MSKLSLTDLANLQNENTVVTAVNANNAAIEAAMEKTLSRDGTSPNQMSTNLDMNNYQVINLPAASGSTSPLRLQDFYDFTGGAVANLPAGGTTGQSLAKNSNTNYDLKWQNSPPTPGVNAADYGVVGNGSTDCTAALNAAFASGTSPIYLPWGVINYSSTITIPDYVEVIGTGNTTLMYTAATGDKVMVGVGSTLAQVGLNHSVTQTSGWTVTLQGNSSTIRDYSMVGAFLGIKMAGTVGSAIVGARIINGTHFSPVENSGSCQIEVDYYSSPYIYNVLCTGVFDLAHPTTQPGIGILIGSGDTLIIDMLHCVGFQKPLWANPPASTNSLTVQIDNSVFDSPIGSFSAAACLNPINTSASLKAWSFNNCWFGGSQNFHGVSIQPFGSGTVEGVTFNGCKLYNNIGGDAFNITNASNIAISGCQISNCLNAGVRIAGTSSNVTVGNNVIANIGGLGAVGAGVILSDSVDYCSISDNILRGTASLTNTSSGSHNKIVNNVGFNPAGMSSITATGTGMTYTSGPSPETIYFTGGSAVVITQLSTTIGASPSTVQLGPNETITIAYSSAPTMAKMIH